MILPVDTTGPGGLADENGEAMPVRHGNIPAVYAQRDPTFAIAFGGGGARGLAHIHVIEVFDELGIRPAAISGSSIGAIMGACMAAGMRGAEIKDYAYSILGGSAKVAGRLWRARPDSIAEMFTGGLRISQFNVERILRAFLPEDFPEEFKELNIPLEVVATDYYGGSQHVFSEGKLFPALAASAAIPAIFRPVFHDERLLIDGGITNPVPFDLLQAKADIIVAIDVVGAPLDGEGVRPGAVDLLFGATQLMMESIVELKLERVRPDILLRPPVSRYRVLDFLKIAQVMGDTVLIKDQLKQKMEAEVARFHLLQDAV